MNLVLWLLAGELVLLALGISAGLFFMNKRRESRLYESVTKLLQAILDSEPGHLEQMRADLLSSYPLSGKNKIDKLSHQILEGEREFFRELIRILLVGDTHALPGLHKNLQGLMTRQRELLQQLGTGAITANHSATKAPAGSAGSVSGLDEAMDTTENDPVGDQDEDLDNLLQAAALGDLDEEPMLVAGGDDGEEPTATTPAAPDDAASEEDDELDTLLQAAALGDLEEEPLLVAGGDDEEDAAMSASVAASPPDEAIPAEDDELDALLQAAALGDLEEEPLLVAGGDDEEEAAMPTSVAASPPDEAISVEDDELDALLQAAALGDLDEDSVLVVGGDDEEEAAMPVSAAPASPTESLALPDEFDALLDDLARMDADPSTPDPAGEDDLAPDIEDILNDLNLAETTAAAVDDIPPDSDAMPPATDVSGATTSRSKKKKVK